MVAVQKRQTTFTNANSRKSGNKFIAVASASEKSRNPDGELVVSGMHLENFRKNPVVLFSHRDDEIPVARADRVWLEGTKLVTEFSFLEGDEFADRVKNAWEQGFLNALSVRFLPMKFQGNRVTESDLLEISIVPLPADPDALRLRSLMNRSKDDGLELLLERAEQEIKRLQLNEQLDEADRILNRMLSKH